MILYKCFHYLVHDFYSSHVHQMANQAAARQSPPETANQPSPISNPIHNTPTSYYHHYHHSAPVIGNQNNAGYSPPQHINQSGSLNGNESPNSVDQYTSNNNNNNIQLPETPNSLVTTIMGPTSGNSNSNDGTAVINESASSDNATIIANNSNYSPWCTGTGHHQVPLSNSSPTNASSYNGAHHTTNPTASFYSAHHNLSSGLIHQNISGFAHPHGGKSFGMSQPFYSWY